MIVQCIYVAICLATFYLVTFFVLVKLFHPMYFYPSSHFLSSTSAFNQTLEHHQAYPQGKLRPRLLLLANVLYILRGRHEENGEQ